MTPQSPDKVAVLRQGFRVRSVVLVALVSAALAMLATNAWRGRDSHGETQTQAGASRETWVCPMHPSIVSDHPGDCPICGMKLVKVEDKGATQAALATPSTSSAPASTNDAPGLATITIDPQRSQLIGLTTKAVERGDVGFEWRTVGRVAIDETRVRRVNVKMSGYVERVYADFVGKAVRQGQALYSIYSPELLAAQEEYLLAVRMRNKLASASDAGATDTDADALVAAARRKLSLWDVADADIDTLEASGKPTRTLTFYSPVSGVVTKKEVVEGMRLEAGAMPYEIVDLSTVWVYAQTYETELRHVRQGLSATLTLSAYPGRTFTGTVAFIDPILDPTTRTAKVRLVFANKKAELMPDMSGEVVLRTRPREALRIAFDAVIDSGTSTVVFVALGEGKLAPRKVILGDSDGVFVEVVDGLKEGEQVVTRANFLVDSESRLRASLADLSKGDSAGAVKPEASAPAAASPPIHQHEGR